MGASSFHGVPLLVPHAFAVVPQRWRASCMARPFIRTTGPSGGSGNSTGSVHVRSPSGPDLRSMRYRSAARSVPLQVGPALRGAQLLVVQLPGAIIPLERNGTAAAARAHQQLALDRRTRARSNISGALPCRTHVPKIAECEHAAKRAVLMPASGRAAQAAPRSPCGPWCRRCIRAAAGR